jgi:hypothetical protein
MTNTETLYLHDIRGLDAIPWLPLAPGWWFVIGVCMSLLIIVAIRYLWVRRDPLVSRCRDARRRLKILRRQVRKSPVKDVGSALSELLRRIAILRSGREDCAGLSGKRWLEWLTENDPNGFDWVSHGQLLLVVPYAPDGADIKRRELARLIDAALGWVDAIEDSRQSGRGLRLRTAPMEPARV